jgi:23S rRNA (pseudouridine1915-N3)-methyltransferase
VKISIVAFQKHKNSDYQAAEAEYIKRLSRFTQIDIREIKSWTQSAELPLDLSKSTFRIGLHVEGKQYESKELANHLQALMNTGNSHPVLVIGGPEGMPAGVESQLQERWSLSPLTFSHQLARVVLLEALYRSFDLLHGGRYHK